MLRLAFRRLPWCFAAVALLLTTTPARSQSSGGLGGSSGGFLGGSGGGSFTGSGSFTGGSSGGGKSGSTSGFLGSTSSTSGTGRGGTTTTPGSTSLLGRYMAEPYSIGIPTGSTSSTASRANWYTGTLAFGTPLYTIPGVSSTGTSGFGGAGGGGQANLVAGRAFPGASTAGVRRAPAYTTTLGDDFNYTAPRVSSIRADLQGVLSRSSRLTSAGSIQVTVDGDTVVLRGRAANPRERRLAEALVRLTPGVHEVRNEITVPKGTTPNGGP